MMASDFSRDPEADMDKLSARLAQLGRQFNDLFERCFERPDLAFETWRKSTINDAHAHEVLKNHLFSLGPMPQGEARQERAIDASLRIADVFQEYRGLRERLDNMHVLAPDLFKDVENRLRADPEPWWVSRTSVSAPSAGPEPDRDPIRGWWRER